jgi:putative nucleotidyltransferase with HDIG domain
MTLQDVLPIPITDFITTLALPTDVFVRLSEDKFILICKAGVKTSLEQLSSYQSKDVQYVWVRKVDYFKLSHQSITLAGLAIRNGDLQTQQKTRVLSAAAKTVFHQFEHVGISTAVYNDAKLITEATVNLVESHVLLADLFESLNDCADNLLQHSMAVSLLSAMVGTAMGWEKRQTIEKLALGGLLHDIGLKTLPPELLTKSLAQMTPEETHLYETHPYRGMQLLLSLGIVPDDVVSIIYEHQENALGQGYPQRIRDIKMHPLARVVSAVDYFTNLTFPNVNCPIPKNAREAIVYMEHTIGAPFNREVFRTLKKVINGENFKVA